MAARSVSRNHSTVALSLQGHHEVDGHTHHRIACRLALEERRPELEGASQVDRDAVMYALKDAQRARKKSEAKNREDGTSVPEDVPTATEVGHMHGAIGAGRAHWQRATR